MEPPVIPPTPGQQKLVTIYLDNGKYATGRTLVVNYGDRHGMVEEHLNPYLAEGWRIASIHGFGGNSDSMTVRGWLAVLLER